MKALNDARSVVEQWYAALAAGDFDAVVGAFHPDIDASVIGSTPVSGRFTGRDQFITGTLGVLFDALDPQQIRFATDWSIFSVDGQRVVGMMTADAVSKNGQPYNGAYCQLFTISGSQIVEYLEFADTVVIENAIFNNPLTRPSTLQREPLTVAQSADRTRPTSLSDLEASIPLEKR
jgi:uncharacterized protein